MTTELFTIKNDKLGAVSTCILPEFTRFGHIEQQAKGTRCRDMLPEAMSDVKREQTAMLGDNESTGIWSREIRHCNATIYSLPCTRHCQTNNQRFVATNGK